MNHIIELKNITKKFDDKYIFKNYNLRIIKGDFLAIVGESGKGKSTLLNIISLIDQKYEGDINIDGKQIDKFDDEGLSMFRNNNIGYVFQNFNLLDDLTVLDNINIPYIYSKKKNNDIRVKRLAKRFNIGDKLSVKARLLSGGEKQRVAILRALISNPKIILADEPTGSLDKGNGTIIFNMLKEINQKFGTTVIIVTHDEGLASMMNKKVVL